MLFCNRIRYVVQALDCFSRAPSIPGGPWFYPSVSWGELKRLLSARQMHTFAIEEWSSRLDLPHDRLR
jgi:hypothetical protein